MSFSDAQVKALTADLNRANVAQRTQAGRSLSYIEGWHAEAEANRIFGFHGWDSETLDLRMVSERARKIGSAGKDGWSVSYLAKVRVVVTTPDGQEIIRDGVGAGHGIDVDLGLAHASAAKEACTDAEKRALKTFGNPFGLALYDKTQAHVSDTDSRPEPKRTEATAPTLSDRADRLEATMRAVKSVSELDKAFKLASALCAELSDKDPDRLAKIEALRVSREEEFGAQLEHAA